MPARDPFEVDLLMSLSSGTVAKMLRLVHEDLDNSQPGCRHMRLIQVALRIKFVPSVTDEGRMPSCKAEVSDLLFEDVGTLVKLMIVNDGNAQ